MRRERDVVRLRERRDPVQLADTPAVRYLERAWVAGAQVLATAGRTRMARKKERTTHVGLRDVERAALKVGPEVEARVEALTERNRRRHRAREVRDLLGLRREQRLYVTRAH